MTGERGQPTISAVVPTRNRRGQVLRCVDALLVDPELLEVVVAVDGDVDGTTDALAARAALDPRVRPLSLEHRGRERARQAGAEAAHGEVLLLLDDDVMASAGLAAAHARHHRNEEGVVVAGYMPVQRAPTRRPGEFAVHVYADDYECVVQRWEDDPGSILTTFWGGNFSIRRADALRVGFVSPHGPLPYREDQDFGLRAHQDGLHGRFDRSLLARHEHRRDVRGFFREAEDRAEGALIVHRVHEKTIGPLDLGRYERSLPPPVRPLVRAGRRRLPAAACLGALRAGIFVAGTARWWKLESLAAIVAMHVIEVRTITAHRAEAAATLP